MSNCNFHAIFTYEFKLGQSAAKATLNIVSVFGEVATKSVRCENDSKRHKPRQRRAWTTNYCNFQRLTEDTSWSRSTQLLTSSWKNWKWANKQFPFTSSKSESRKSSTNSCLTNWIKINEIVVTKFHLPFFCATKTIHSSIEWWYATKKWILYHNRRRLASWLDHDEALQHFSKPQLHQKKVIYKEV